MSAQKLLQDIRDLMSHVEALQHENARLKAQIDEYREKLFKLEGTKPDWTYSHEPDNVIINLKGGI